MDLVKVDSSMVYAVGYDTTAEELEVVFTSGRIWRYRGVSRRVYEELLAADSKGQYMHGHILGAFPEYEISRRRR